MRFELVEMEVKIWNRDFGIALVCGLVLILFGPNPIESIDFPKIPGLSSSSNSSNGSNTSPSKVSSIIGGEKCYGEFGCFKRFPASSFFSKLVKLVGSGLYPTSPEEVDVTYFMFTCSNRYRPYYLYWNSTDDEVRQSTYDPNRRTVFIIHGYTDSYKEFDWMGDLKDYIMNVKNRIDLEDGSCTHNVIGVDWSGGSQTILYPQSVANTQMVGASVAKLIKQFIRVNPQNKPSDFTVVGHSLGAHASGFVGTHFQQEKLRNIIGLDPAGPAFHDIPDSHRLDPSDAQLVLSITTNGGKILGDSFGIDVPLGHYSFFPNGGADQPGCEKVRGISNLLLDGLFKGMRDTIACSHLRATILVQFNESLVTTAQSMAYVCKDHQSFVDGKCGSCFENPDGCKPFGRWFDFWQEYQLPRNWTKPISYYIDTTDEKPYTMYHHQMIIRTRNQFRQFRGYIKVTPMGIKRDAEQIKIDPGTIKPNSTYTYLIKVPKGLGDIVKALVRIKNEGVKNSIVKIAGLEGEDYNPGEVIEEIWFNYMSHENRAVREEKSTTLVPTNDTEIYRIRKVGYVFLPKQRSRPEQNGPRPNQNGPQPDQNRQRPDQNGPRPDQNEQRPNQNGPRQEQNTTRPEQNGPRSDQNGPRPDQNRQRQEQNRTRPEQNGQRPDQNGQRPDQSGPRPDQNGPRQEQNTTRPEQNGPRSDQNGPRSDQNRQRQEQNRTRPDQNGQRPDQSGPRPDQNRQRQEQNRT